MRIISHWGSKPQAVMAIALFCALSACSDSSNRNAPSNSFSTMDPAVDQLAAIDSGLIKPSELLERYIDRMDELNPALNAIVAYDVDSARERALAADEALERGERWGPLHGLTITIKDTIDVAGLTSTYGNPAFADFVPTENAASVQRLLDAGAIVLGKTNTPLFAGDWQTYNDVYGTTNNPWDLSLTPGGSSGGSATAVATGMSGLGLGGDLAGSLRIPAHFTGVYSHKPSFGLVPMDGHFSRTVLPPAPEPPGFIFGVLGPIARSVEDLKLAMQVLAADQWNELPAPQPTTLNDIRVAAWINDPNLKVDYEVLSTLDAVLSRLKDNGNEISVAKPALDLRKIADDYRTLRLHNTGRLRLSPEALDSLLAARDSAIDQIREFFSEYDILLLPVAPVTAFPHDQTDLLDRTLMVNGEEIPYFRIDEWSALAQYGDLPVTTVPVGLSRSGLPIGIQVIAENKQDRLSLLFSELLDDTTGGFIAPE